MGGSIPQALLLLLLLLLSPYTLKQNPLRQKEKKFSKRKGKPKRNVIIVPLPPKAKHPKAKGKENFKKKRKTKEKYKEKIKPENFQHQPLFPQHLAAARALAAWANGSFRSSEWRQRG